MDSRHSLFSLTILAISSVGCSSKLGVFEATTKTGIEVIIIVDSGASDVFGDVFVEVDPTIHKWIHLWQGRILVPGRGDLVIAENSGTRNVVCGQVRESVSGVSLATGNWSKLNQRNFSSVGIVPDGDVFKFGDWQLVLKDWNDFERLSRKRLSRKESLSLMRIPVGEVGEF